MKKIGILLIASTLALSACGKRDDGTTSGITGYDADGNPIGGELAGGLALGQSLKIRINSTPPSIDTGGNEIAEISAVITDDNNLPMADIPVAFSSTDGVLIGASPTTDENGKATVSLSLEHDAANQDIIVKIVADNYSNEARVVARGSTLEVVGADNVVLGNDVEISAKLTAGSGDPLANEVITISSQAGNTLSSTTATTDPDGLVTVTVGSSNGNDVLSFSALPNSGGIATVSQLYEMTVSDDQLKFADDSPTELPVNEAHNFMVNWSYNGVPIANKDLKFTITAGQVVSGATARTDANGNATVSVLSSIAGEVALYAEALDGSVINKHTFNFVGVIPASISVSATSTRITTRDKATIAVQVFDANGNAVKDTNVVFSSANLKGGQISSTTATTNTDGSAEITFTAGAAATEADEIAIFAEVEGTSINNSVLLTVAEPALNVTIGSSGKVDTRNNDTQYAVPYVVQVADGSGQALEGATVNLSIFTVEYTKGFLDVVDSLGRTGSAIPADEAFSEDAWAFFETATCGNEDANGNRFLDAGEDINQNGILDPQDPALISATEASLGLQTLDANGVLITDVNGSGYFDLVHPASNSHWYTVVITARAQALGVESEAHFETRLWYPSTVVDNTGSTPPFVISPFGTSQLCTD